MADSADDAATRRAERLARARALAAQGHFAEKAAADNQSAEEVVATTSETVAAALAAALAAAPPSNNPAVGSGRLSKGGLSFSVGRGASDGRGRGSDPNRGRGRGRGRDGPMGGRGGVFAAETASSSNGASPPTASRFDEKPVAEAPAPPVKVWQPKSARALEMGPVKTTSIEPEVDMVLPGGDDVERPTLLVQFASDYDTFAEIGKGAFGVVSAARLKNKAKKKTAQPEVVAMKQLRFDFEKEGFPLEALREITLLSSLRHPNIVRMHAVACGDGEFPSEWHLVMEPAGHELTTLVKGARRRPFSEPHVKHLMLQLLRALGALHSVWVMHRDLKTPNVLVDDRGVLRLCDFGLARRVCCGYELDEVQFTGETEKFGGNFAMKLYDEDYPGVSSSRKRRKPDNEKDSSTTHTGGVISGHYRPPEVLLGCRDYGRSVDLWSAGCIMGELLSRVVLFAGKDEPDQLRQIFTLLGEPAEAEWPLYPHLSRARGFRFEVANSTLLSFKKQHGSGGSDLLRRRFPATGFDGQHPPLSAVSLVTPLSHVTTALSNTGFSVLSRLLECCPERRITADAAKRDKWFSTRPGPEALTSNDIEPLLQLAKLTDVSPTVPQFMGTGFSSQPLPSILLAQGNANFSMNAYNGMNIQGMVSMQPAASVAAALAVARARALALGNIRE